MNHLTNFADLLHPTFGQYPDSAGTMGLLSKQRLLQAVAKAAYLLSHAAGNARTVPLYDGFFSLPVSLIFSHSGNNPGEGQRSNLAAPLQKFDKTYKQSRTF